MLHYKDSELLYLANRLPAILLLDKAPNTVKKYFSAFRKWEFWANSKSVSALPADVKIFPLFLVSLIDSSNSLSTFNSIIYGVDWAYKTFGLQSPTKSLISKQIIELAKRIIGKSTTNRKLPLERYHVQLLQHKFVRGNLEQLRIVTLITLGFVAFLR